MNNEGLIVFDKLKKVGRVQIYLQIIVKEELPKFDNN